MAGGPDDLSIRIDAWMYGPLNPVNDHYGSTFVLRLYCGLPLPVPPIWGLLQHAWEWRAPLWGEPAPRLWPIFVYSEHNRFETQRLSQRVRQPAIAIGAPFLYLTRLLGLEDRPPVARPESAIFYPRHGVDPAPQAERIEDVLSQLDPSLGVTTICLHFHDFANRDLRLAYERPGYEVITHGVSSDPTFPFRQLAELLRHGSVISTRPSTALWHGGALGLSMKVVDVGIDPSDPPAHALQPVADQRQRWPELFAPGGMTGAEAIRLARAELGADSLRQPDELAGLLGWTGWTRRKAAAVMPAVRLRDWSAGLRVARDLGGWGSPS